MPGRAGAATSHSRVHPGVGVDLLAEIAGRRAGATFHPPAPVLGDRGGEVGYGVNAAQPNRVPDHVPNRANLTRSHPSGANSDSRIYTNRTCKKAPSNPK